MTTAQRRAAVRAWFLAHHWPASRRRRAATVLSLIAIVLATTIASSRLLRLVFTDLDVLAYAGLFIAAWVGAGGALVPIPGVRPMSWLMVIHQGAALDPVTVAIVAATAMALGQSSYFLVTRGAARAVPAAAGRVKGGGAAVDGSRPGGEAAPDEAPPDEVEGPDAPGPPVAPRPSDEPGPPDEASPDAPGPPVEAQSPDAATAPPEAHAVEARSRRARTVHAARSRIDRQVRQHPYRLAFITTALPSPMTTMSTVASAAIGTRYPRWLVAAFGGYLVFCSVLALVGQSLIYAFRSLFG
jgi:hypothetical protein